MLALLVYDWLLCLDHEATLIWNWNSKVTGSSLVYAVSRYAVLISNLLSVITSFPLSDRVRSISTMLNFSPLIMFVEVSCRALGGNKSLFTLILPLQLRRGRMDSNCVYDSRYHLIQWYIQSISHSPHELTLEACQPSLLCVHMHCLIETNGWPA